MPPEKVNIAQSTVPPISLRRRVTDRVMTGLSVLTVIIVLAPLFAIFAYLVYRGIGSIDWNFLTQTPKPVGEAGGGMANATIPITIEGTPFKTSAVKRIKPPRRLRPYSAR